MKVNHRDVTFINIDKNKSMVIGCDSCGSVGEKKLDHLQVKTELTGQLTARVCLMELISIGADLKALTVNICNEPHPTGAAILKGIQKELYSNKLSSEIIISTEKNMPTQMTALGITTVGIINNNDILLNRVRSGDNIYLIGIPYVGREVISNLINLPTLKHIKDILEDWEVNEVIPIGSTGVEGELRKLCDEYNLSFNLSKIQGIDTQKSCGPCSAIIIISSNNLDYSSDVPFNLIGTIY